MKNIKLTILGAVVLVAALALNLRHALNDYGVRDNKLHVEVLAQSNGSGGGGSTDNGGGSTDDYHSDYILGYALIYKDGGITTATCKVGGEISIFGIVIKGNYDNGGNYSLAWESFSCVAVNDPKCKCEIAKQGIRINGVQVGSGT